MQTSVVVTRDLNRARYPFLRADLRFSISLGLSSLAINSVQFCFLPLEIRSVAKMRESACWQHLQSFFNL